MSPKQRGPVHTSVNIYRSGPKYGIRNIFFINTFVSIRMLYVGLWYILLSNSEYEPHGGRTAAKQVVSQNNVGGL